MTFDIGNPYTAWDKMTLEGLKSIEPRKIRCYSSSRLKQTAKAPEAGNEMIELVTTVIITVSSVLLFGYWFRYTCLLILSAKTTRDFAGEVATGESARLPRSPGAVAGQLRAIWIRCAMRSIAITRC